MRFSLAVFALLAASVAGKAQAQGTSVYAEGSVSRFHNLYSDSYLSGGKAGIRFTVYHRAHFNLGGDVQGKFLAGSGRAYSAASVGPLISVPVHFLQLTPFGELLIGSGRFSGNAQDAFYHGAAGNQTTDSELQIIAGVTRKLTSRFDAVVEYGYAQFYAYGGEFNPKSFSAGAVIHFGKR